MRAMGILSSLLSSLLLFLCSIWNSSSTSPSDDGGHVCVSQGGRFPKFAFEGKPPRPSVKGRDDLTLCRIYRKRTCCTAAQTHPALIAVRKLASNGEASEQCLSFWEAMECAICDPQVGVRKGPPALCSSFCDISLEACKNAFFSFDSMAQVLQPCGPKDTICAQATEWAANGSHFCELAGFVVPSLRNLAEPFCFDGKPSLDTDISANKKSGRKGGFRKRRSLGNILRNLISMVTSDIIVWAVGGLVLTAGAILVRMLDRIFRPHRALVETLFDDMIVFLKTNLEHREYLRVVFEELRRNCLKINEKKNEFNLEEICFIGLVTSKEVFGNLQHLTFREKIVMCS